MSPERRNPDDVLRVGALDLPEDASPVLVSVLRAAAGPVDDAELVGEAAAVAAFVRQNEAPSASSIPTRIRSNRSTGLRPRMSLRTVRALAAAAVISLVLGGGLAAADVLPTPAQRWVSRALGVVGIDVPSPDHPRSSASVVPNLSPADVETSPATSATATTVGPGRSAAGQSTTPTTASSPGSEPQANLTPASTAPGGPSVPGSDTSNDGNGQSTSKGAPGSSSRSQGSRATGSKANGSTANGSKAAGSTPAQPSHGRKSRSNKPTSAPQSSRAVTPTRPAPAAPHRP